jgi:hypothetical protein
MNITEHTAAYSSIQQHTAAYITDYVVVKFNKHASRVASIKVD